MRSLVFAFALLCALLATERLARAWVALCSQTPEQSDSHNSSCFNVNSSSINGDLNTSVAYVSASYVTHNSGKDVGAPDACGAASSSGDHTITVSWIPEDGFDSGTANWHTTMTHAFTPNGGGNSSIVSTGVIHGSYVVETTYYSVTVNGQDQGLSNPPPLYLPATNPSVSSGSYALGVKATLNNNDLFQVTTGTVSKSWGVTLHPWLDSEGMGHPSSLRFSVSTCTSGIFDGHNTAPSGGGATPEHQVSGLNGNAAATLGADVTLTIEEPHA